MHEIRLVAARENNLKSLNVTIPQRALTVVTGPSGSGKSSLVFDTIYKEARRTFLEPLVFSRVSAKGRPLRSHSLPRADVGSISGLSMAVAVDAKRFRIPQFATLASFTGTYDYLCQLFYHAGVGICPKCGGKLVQHSRREILQTIEDCFSNEMIQVLAPVASVSAVSLRTKLDSISSSGYSIVEINKNLINLSSAIEIAEYLDEMEQGSMHSVSLVIDMFTVKMAADPRLIDAVDLGLAEAEGVLQVRLFTEGRAADMELDFSEKLSCGSCGLVHDEFFIGEYSYYREAGACDSCLGGGCESSTGSDQLCLKCGGARVKSAARTRMLAAASFADVFTAPVSEVRDWSGRLCSELSLPVPDSSNQAGLLSTSSAKLLLRAADELNDVLTALCNIGLSYLPLSRSLSTLSAGELQRARIARDLGKPLPGLIYLLDEPTTALHPEDGKAVLSGLRALVETGASVIAVEHDPQFIRGSDYVLELGPGSGMMGGELVFSGTQDEFRITSSETAQHVYTKADPYRLEAGGQDWGELELNNINYRNIDIAQLKIPLNRLCVITGVSGSGKSTLLFDCILPALKDLSADHKGIGQVRGAESLKRIIDCSSVREISSTRSTVATIAGVLDPLRSIFAKTIDAKIRGFGKAEFSYNTASGCCEFCRGSGEREEILDAFSTIRSLCPRCQGSRYRAAVREIRYRGHSITDVMSMSVEQAGREFAAVPSISRRLQLLCDLGLAYLPLDFSGRYLSLGELQRLQLASDFLRVKEQKGVLYAFDEPTRGLGVLETKHLLTIFEDLLDQGCSVLVIEHNRELVHAAQHIIELGPGAGVHGGQLVYSGRFEGLVECQSSKIGAYS